MSAGEKQAPFNAPFSARAKELKKQLKKAKKQSRGRPPPVERPASTPASKEKTARDDATMFLEAVGGAAPIERSHRAPRRPPPPKAHELTPYDEDAEVLAELASLIEGTTRFDIEDSDEYMQGIVEGLDRRILQRLKRGDYAVQAHLDLHGLTRDPARREVIAFIAEARRVGRRCVRIVHGRGLNSKDNIPVLKLALTTWLERGGIAKHVLAFCSARPQDGGSGAVYVLLRK